MHRFVVLPFLRRNPVLNLIRTGEGLALNKEYSSTIILWSYCEVNPIAALLGTLYQDFIEVPLCTIGDIQQNVGIAEGLLYTLASNINCTTCQVVAGWRASSEFVHFW